MPYVEYYFYIGAEDKSLTPKAYNFFYERWIGFLELRLTIVEQNTIRVLIDVMNSKYKTRDEAAESLEIRKDRFNERLQEIKQKINKYISHKAPALLKQLKAMENQGEGIALKISLLELIKEEPIISTQQQIIHFIKKYSLLKS